MGSYLSRVIKYNQSEGDQANDSLNKKRARKRKYDSESEQQNDNLNDDANEIDESTSDDTTTSTTNTNDEFEQNQSVEDELSQNLSTSSITRTTQLTLDRFRRRLNGTPSNGTPNTTNNDEIRQLFNNTSASTPTTPTHVTPSRHKLKASKIKEKNSRIEKKLKTPTKKKMKSTSTYIYSTLYLKGENSDIIVRALGKDWHLHKIYLCQSPYFSSMLQAGKWKESRQSSIEISIPDSNINESALFIAFGCLYKDDIELVPNEVVNVLAAASLFSLEGLLNECESIMLENISVKTVFYYYEASMTYGLQKVTEKTLKWLTMNIMISNDLNLQEINLNLFLRILSSKDLMIIQVETDLYTLCKRWLYFHLIRKYDHLVSRKSAVAQVTNTTTKGWQKNASEFFTNFMRTYGGGDGGTEINHLLDVSELSEYVPLFKLIRFQHMLTDFSSLKVICNDRIIPKAWIQSHYVSNWQNTLYLDQQLESSEFLISEIDFSNECVRFGRILNDDILYTWRWVGFHFGIDLLVTYMHRSFTLKRNTMYIYSPYKGFLSNKATQRIYFKMYVAQLDKYGNIKWSKQTEFTCLDLHRNEEKFVFNLDNNITFPLIMNLHVAFHPSLNTNLLQDSSSAIPASS